MEDPTNKQPPHFCGKHFGVWTYSKPPFLLLKVDPAPDETRNPDLPRSQEEGHDTPQPTLAFYGLTLKQAVDLVLSDIIDRHNVYLGYATRNPH